MNKKTKTELRQARVNLVAIVNGQQIGREVLVWASNEAEARSNARAKAGPLYEVTSVRWE